MGLTAARLHNAPDGAHRTAPQHRDAGKAMSITEAVD